MRASLPATVLALALLLAASPGARAGDEKSPSRALMSQRITVERGDTLNAIAARNKVKVDDIRRWNRGRIGKNDVIRAGSTLLIKVPADRADPARVPGSKATTRPADNGAKPAASKTGERPPGSWEDRVHVERGDTLSKLAARLEVSLDELMAWNKLTKRSKLRAGQTLVVYRPGPRPAPQSRGRPTSGTLDYAQHLGEGVGYRLRFPKNAYGVDGVLETLRRCARRVHEGFPGTHDVLIGDISRPGGGRFRPHESHQSGRDADVGYYLASNEQNKTMYRVKPAQVDLAKTWALLRCHIGSDAVVRVYMDAGIQRAMVDWLRDNKRASDELIGRLFEVEGDEDALVRHAKEHDTHFHVRFACDRGQSDCVEEEDDDQPFRL